MGFAFYFAVTSYQRVWFCGPIEITARPWTSAWTGSGDLRLPRSSNAQASTDFA